MRRLLVLSALLVAIQAPVGWASPHSVSGEVENCYDFEVTIPPYSPNSRVCQPQPVVVHIPPIGP